MPPDREPGTPVWLLPAAVYAMHQAQLDEHGGLSGLRDEGALLSALARPVNLHHYGNPTTFELAAAYAASIIQNHPFADGNKRTGLLAAFVFLYLNGQQLRAPEAEAVVMTLGLAAGTVDEAGYARWLADNSKAKEGEDGR